METFSAGSCIRFGWETFKKRPWFFIGSYLLVLVVVGIVTAILNEGISQGGTIAVLADFVRIVFDMFIGIGMISFVLKAHDDVEHVSIANFWNPAPFWKYVGATVLFSLLVLAGLILVVIPGIIWAIMFGFAGYLVIDKAMGPIEAMKESRRITRGSRWELFLLGLLTILLMLLGVVCILVGLLVAYPIVALATAHAYRTLSQKAATTTSAI